ncbi:MAG: hypothetical protein ACREIG_08755, partial [Nitrospiraceae bacterium]
MTDESRHGSVFSGITERVIEAQIWRGLQGGSRTAPAPPTSSAAVMQDGRNQPNPYGWGERIGRVLWR